MATIFSYAGPRISVLPDARPLWNEKYVRARGENASQRERGDFVSVRVDIPHYKEDVLEEHILWIPVAKADCVFDGSCFVVISGPQNPRVAQYFLDRLNEREIRDLMRDMKQV